MGFPYSLEQPAKMFLADCVKNLGNLMKAGHEPTMDIEMFGIHFEFRIKPDNVAVMKQAACDHVWADWPIAGDGQYCMKCGKRDFTENF